MSELTPYPRGAAAREEAVDSQQLDVVHGGWWRRAAALLIDSLLIWVVVVAVIGIGLGVAAANDTAGGIVLILAIVFALAGPIFYTIYWTGKGRPDHRQEGARDPRPARGGGPGHRLRAPLPAAT